MEVEKLDVKKKSITELQALLWIESCKLKYVEANMITLQQEVILRQSKIKAKKKKPEAKNG